MKAVLFFYIAEIVLGLQRFADVTESDTKQAILQKSSMLCSLKLHGLQAAKTASNVVNN